MASLLREEYLRWERPRASRVSGSTTACGLRDATCVMNRGAYSAGFSFSSGVVYDQWEWMIFHRPEIR
jgi:hypothetical protein